MVDYFITFRYAWDCTYDNLFIMPIPVPPETMEKSVSSSVKLYSSVFWNSKQLGMLHYNEESNIMKYRQEKGIVSLEKCIAH